MTNEHETIAFEAAMNVAADLARAGASPEEVKKASNSVINAALSAAKLLSAQDAQ